MDYNIIFKRSYWYNKCATKDVQSLMQHILYI